MKPQSAGLIAGLVLLAAVSARTQDVNAEELPFHPTFVRSNAGWHIHLQLFTPVKEILVARGEEEAFRSTGFLQTLDPETRQPQANPSITLVEVVPLRLRLVTPDGEELGPYPVEFDPLSELQEQGKRILESTGGSWMAFRTMEGYGNRGPQHLVYFSHLSSYRCAIREVRYSFETVALDRRYELPPCDPSNPFAIPSDFDGYLNVDRPYAWTAVQLVYADGTESEVQRLSW